jgi:hypothetical protein
MEVISQNSNYYSYRSEIIYFQSAEATKKLSVRESTAAVALSIWLGAGNPTPRDWASSPPPGRRPAAAGDLPKKKSGFVHHLGFRRRAGGNSARA